MCFVSVAEWSIKQKEKFSKFCIAGVVLREMKCLKKKEMKLRLTQNC